MAGILIERGGYLREILRLLGAAAWDCRWLITGLECYQTQGWPGCEKWNRETPLLSNEDLNRDIEARDMQFVWGIFSAIPARYTREEIVVLAVFNGVLCSAAVPLLIRFFYTVLT